MNRWINGVVDQVTAMAAADEHYQEILEQCEMMEQEYIRIMETLSEEEYLVVDDYIALCEQLQYRMTQLAYELGLREGRRGNILVR